MAEHAPRDVRRAQILESAQRVFAEQGYHATRMDDIVAACGLSKGAIYHHFENKDAVWHGVFERYAAELERTWATIEAEDPLERLYRQGALTIDVLVTSRDLLGMWTGFFAHPQTRQQFGEIYGVTRAMLAAEMAGAAPGAVDPAPDAQAAAALFVGAVEGLLLQALVDPQFDPRAAWDAAWPILERGLRANTGQA